MSSLEFFGLSLDDSGSNLSQLAFLFADGTGEQFRTALGRAFYAAYQTKPATNQGKGKKNEWWDTTVQRQLKQQNWGLTKECELLLEKTDKSKKGTVVWQYGYHIFQDSPSGERFWCLPDGVITLPNSEQVIALELDHGSSANNWADKLLKAMRILSSTRISGLLFCYCAESKKPFFKSQLFSPEFEEAMGSKVDDKGCYLKKPIGILNIWRGDLEQFNQPS
jgi:hypothetical protein